MESLSKLKEKLRLEAQQKEIEAPLERGSLVLSRLLPLLPEKGLVLSYCSLKREVSMDQVNAYLLERGRLVLPKIVAGKICPVQILTSTEFEKSSWGVLEPREPLEVLDLSNLSCVIIPGLLFDKNGNRMGRGKGCYDRLLAHLKCPKIGVVFQEFLYSDLPAEPHDEKIDHLVVL